MDPRLFIISKRLKDVKRTLAVVSGKGGVGKTLVASTMALALAERRIPVGLLDLDVTNPSCHVVLGVEPSKETPPEDMGVLPVSVHGLKFMSVAFYTRGEALPLRGTGVDDVFKEILTITRWGRLEVLILDTPPGFGDAVLDIAAYIPDAEFIAVTTPSRLSVESLRRLARTHLGKRVVGVIVNMVWKEYDPEEVEKAGFKLLATIPYCLGLEESIGNPDRLLKTEFAEKLDDVVNLLLR